MFKVSWNNDIPFTPHNESVKMWMKKGATGEEGIMCFHWFENEEEIAKYWTEPVSDYGICNFDTLVSTKVMCESCPIYCKEEIEDTLKEQRERLPA